MKRRWVGNLYKACVATADTSHTTGVDGNFYCLHGTIGGEAGGCTCTCDAESGYYGPNCATAYPFAFSSQIRKPTVRFGSGWFLRPPVPVPPVPV